MISFFSYMVAQIGNLINLWQDSRITNAIGANFLYIILSIWLFWLMANIFLIHPNVGGGLFDSVISHSKATSKVKARSSNSISVKSDSDDTEGS